MTSKSGNPFLNEEEVEDFYFVNHPKQGRDGYMLQTDDRNTAEDRRDDPDDSCNAKRQQLLEECRRIEQETLQSSVNSLGLIHESEQIGTMTAEELVHQREQLQNVEQNLDSINSTMRISQKHINSIKSMFGGIKNYFSRGNTSDTPAMATTQVSSTKPPTSSLQERIGNLKVPDKTLEASHPALRIRGLDTQDFSSSPSDEDLGQYASGSSRDAGMSQTSVTSYSQNIDEQLDKNLEFMSVGLGRLKNLAIGLNEEIEVHNDMLERIHTKTDRADESLEHQNRQIKRILKK